MSVMLRLLLLLVGSIAFTSSFNFPICSLPRAPLGGHVSLGRGGAVATYSCKSGYELEGRSVAVCVGGKWSSLPPRCSLLTSAEAAESLHGSAADGSVTRLEDPRLMDQQIITVYTPPDPAILARLRNDDDEPKKVPRRKPTDKTMEHVVQPSKQHGFTLTTSKPAQLRPDNAAQRNMNSVLSGEHSNNNNRGRDENSVIDTGHKENTSDIDVIRHTSEGSNALITTTDISPIVSANENNKFNRRKYRRRKGRRKNRRKGERRKRRKNGRDRRGRKKFERNLKSGDAATGSRRTSGRSSTARPRLLNRARQRTPPPGREAATRLLRRRRLRKGRREKVRNNTSSTVRPVQSSVGRSQNNNNQTDNFSLVETPNSESSRSNSRRRGEKRQNDGKRKNRRRDRTNSGRRRERKRKNRTGLQRKTSTDANDFYATESTTLTASSNAESSTSRFLIINPGYTVEGKQTTDNSIVNIVTDESLSRSTTNTNNILSNRVENGEVNDLLGSLDQSGGNVESNSIDSLLSLYRKIANKKRARNRQKNRQNILDANNAADYSDRVTNTEEQRNKKNSKVRDDITSYDSNRVTQTRLWDSEKEYDSQVTFDEDSEIANSNVEDFEDASQESVIEESNGMSQELPEGYPIDRLKKERHKTYHSRFQETEDIDFGELDTSCIISSNDRLFLPPPRVRNTRVSSYHTVTNPEGPHNSYLEVAYECNFNYEMREGVSNRLFCRSNTWLGTLPVCEHYRSGKRECGEDNGGCEQICERTDDGVYQCFCYKGFRLYSDRFSCVDINECLKNNGGCDDICNNEVGTHACSCSLGYRRATNGRSCIDKNECLLRNGHGPCQDRCHNTDGSYSCSCDSFPGTHLSEDKHSCVDVDECQQNNGECAHICLNTFGQIFCTCRDGFLLGMDWKSCNDVDECSYPHVVAECSPLKCVNIPGSYRCAAPDEEEPVTNKPCPPGTTPTEDNSDCEDIDECSSSESNHCSHLCINGHGSYICSCPLGYQLSEDQRTCQDLDECESGDHECSNSCSNVLGSYTCSCPPGHTLLPDQNTCQDVDECADSPCSHGCRNKPGSFRCTCPRKYVLAPDKLNCIDKNECADSNGGCSHLCHNTDGSYTCRCYDGFTLMADGSTCEDVDECSQDLAQCQQGCINTEGGYECNCSLGYELVDQHNCTDLNECELQTHDCRHICQNVAGSFRCSCFEGFTLDSASNNCTDIDECSAEAGCSHFCSNNNGSYLCHCPPGFELSSDQHNCLDVNECENDRAGCSHTCSNIDGGYECSCKQGFEMIKEGTLYETKHDCVDIDECKGKNGNCSHECINTEGSFECECPKGFKLIKLDDESPASQCADINECEIDNGKCSSKCINLIGSFECLCPKGYKTSLESNNIDGTHECEDVDECAENNGECSQSCNNLMGSYECSCSAGFEFDIPTDYYDDYAENEFSAEFVDNGWWKICVDIDECHGSNGKCSHDCVNEEGSYRCQCPAGYELSSDQLTCADIDECRTEDEICSDICSNTPGSFVCSCPDGFKLENGKCSDIDECLLSNCPCSHTCTNEIGTYKCSCPLGHILEDDNKTCSDINECGIMNGGCNHICKNKQGLYSCSCLGGFKLSIDNHTCHDIDECDLTEDACTDTCHNTPGSFTCSCEEGKKLAIDQKTCVDIDECGLNNGGCSHECSNRAGHYQCLCTKGYQLSSDLHNCVDTNECQQDNGNCEYKCVNHQGSYECLCETGFRLRGDNATCQDIDECGENIATCEMECHNTRGSFRCGCSAGYRLSADEENCEDVDECQTASGGCSHSCTNTIGSFQCSCVPGYRLSSDGLVCLDVDECSSSPCTHSCLNSLGSYACLCKQGYQPVPHAPHECRDVNECEAEGHGCGQDCYNTLGSYTCSCRTGYLLGSDKHSCEAEAVYCPLLVAPLHGSQKCTPRAVGEAYEEGAVCVYSCDYRSVLHGALNTTCTHLGTWDNEPPTCIASKCSILASVEHGRLSPSRCSRRTSSTGEHCYLSCSPGYSVVGNPVRTCQQHGHWSPLGASPFCEKATVRPFIQCPSDVTVPLPAHQNSAYVRIPQPKANVDWFRFVDASPVWAKELEGDLPAGKTTLTFTARSPGSDDSASCTFSVHVVDSEEPRVSGCPSSFVVELANGASSAVATWTEPLFTDNVEITHIWKSMKPGRRLTAGTYPVHYVASDAYKNRAKCSFTVSIQAFGPSAQVPYESSRVMAVCPGLNGGNPIQMFAWRVPPACTVVWARPVVSPALWDTTRTRLPVRTAGSVATGGPRHTTEPTAAPSASGALNASTRRRGDLGSHELVEETKTELFPNNNFKSSTTTLTSYPNNRNQYHLQYHQHVSPAQQYPYSYYSLNNNYIPNKPSNSHGYYNNGDNNYQYNRNVVSKEASNKDQYDSSAPRKTESSYHSNTDNQQRHRANAEDSEHSSERSAPYSRSSGYHPTGGVSATSLIQQMFPSYRGQSSTLALAHAQASGGGRGGSSTALAHAQGVGQALAHARVYSSG